MTAQRKVSVKEKPQECADAEPGVDTRSSCVCVFVCI